MNILDEAPLALGYFDTILGGIKEINNIKFSLNPFETKLFTLYVYGTSLEVGNSIALSTVVRELISQIKIKISIEGSVFETKYWTNIDSTTVRTDAEPIKVLVEVTNTRYTELNSSIIFSISHFKGEYLQAMSYYGALDTTPNGYKVLKINPEIFKDRMITIIPTPDNDGTTYLAYSHGNSLIILDNGTAIPYNPTESIIVDNQEAIVSGPGYYKWDTGEFIQWEDM